MTTPITKEWLQKSISEMESARDDIPFGLDEDGSNTLSALKMALAAMDAEPERCGHVNLDCDDGKAVCLSCGKVWEV